MTVLHIGQILYSTSMVTFSRYKAKCICGQQSSWNFGSVHYWWVETHQRRVESIRYWNSWRNHWEVIRKRLVIWTKEQSENWPISTALVSSVIEHYTQVAGIANNSMVGDSPIDWNRFSSFSNCVRAIAYCLRLKYNSQSEILTSDELQRTEERALKLIQIETFSDFCNGKQDVKKTNNIGI